MSKTNTEKMAPETQTPEMANGKFQILSCR